MSEEERIEQGEKLLDEVDEFLHRKIVDEYDPDFLLEKTKC